MKLATAVIIAACTAGCASQSGVVAIGPDAYLASKQAATGFPGLGNMKAELISEGTAHCAKQGKAFQLTATRETEGPYILGNYPRSEIQFTCVK